MVKFYFGRMRTCIPTIIITLDNGGNSDIFEAVVRSRNAGSGSKLANSARRHISEESIFKTMKNMKDRSGRLGFIVNNFGILINLFPTAFTTTRGLVRKLPTPTYLARLCFLKHILFYNTNYKSRDTRKAALNIFAVNYARLLKDVGEAYNAVCLGLVKTKSTGYQDHGTSVEVGAERSVSLVANAPGGLT
ncbi:hypothetical protein LX36DRAFT_682728 [Colletotrichum falcatum]|nr:hypothetical protein LX36DRAFT_682728 [Colletotrichum falcatum]